jgi:hypothetical protein
MIKYILHTLVRVSCSSHSAAGMPIHMYKILYITTPISSVICLLLDNYSHGPECTNIFILDDIPFFINTKHSFILCTSPIKLGHKSFIFVDIFRLHVNWIHSQCPPTELHLSFRSHAFLCFCCHHCSDTCSQPQRVLWNIMKMWIGVQRIFITDCLGSLIYENFSQLYRLWQYRDPYRAYSGTK